MDPEPYDVLAVELSSFQLHYTDSMSAESAAVLNIAEDHLDWYPGPAAWPTTPPTRAASTSGSSAPASTTWPTPRPSGWSARPTCEEGARAIGFTLGMPGVGMLGVVEDILADRAFVEERETSAAELCTIADLARTSGGPPRTTWRTRWPPPRWPAPTASPRPRSATGCAASAPTATGSPRSRSVDGVRWVDDSKATNPHAARSSLQAYDSVVWVAGGLAKGARFDDLVLATRRPAAGRGAPRAGPRRDRARRFRDTRPMCPFSSSRAAKLGPTMWTGRASPWSASWRRPPRWPGPGTPCCSPPDAPPWTCSPTTPRGATPSPRRSAAGATTTALTRRGRDEMTTANPEHGPPRAPGRPSGATSRHAYAAYREVARPAAHVVLPAARRLGAAADHRPDHGAQRLERLVVREQRRRLLRRGQAPADVGGARRCPRAWVASRMPQRWIRGSPGRATSSRWCCCC